MLMLLSQVWSAMSEAPQLHHQVMKHSRLESRLLLPSLPTSGDSLRGQRSKIKTFKTGWFQGNCKPIRLTATVKVNIKPNWNPYGLCFEIFPLRPIGLRLLNGESGSTQGFCLCAVTSGPALRVRSGAFQHH